MTTSIDTTHLIHDQDGNVVPWVTRWSGEVQERGVAVQVNARGNLRISYDDAVPDNREGELLWQREGISRGGRPQWRHVNTLRQRACMRKGLCEVCGRKIDTRPIHWLIPKFVYWTSFEGMDFGDPITMQPPTCDDCLPIALELCPHLSSSPDDDFIMLKVLEWRLYGVFGSAFARQEDGSVGIEDHVLWPEGSAGGDAAVLAQQQVIQFVKYAVSEVGR